MLVTDFDSYYCYNTCHTRHRELIELNSEIRNILSAKEDITSSVCSVYTCYANKIEEHTAHNPRNCVTMNIISLFVFVFDNKNHFFVRFRFRQQNPLCFYFFHLLLNRLNAGHSQWTPQKRLLKKTS